MKTIINFILWSSVNPQKVSLTIKAGVPFVVALLAMIGLNLDLTELADQLILIINTFTLLISAGFTMYGMLRKAILTLRGQNKVL